MAHFWVSPGHHDAASFGKAVALVERAAQTLALAAHDMRAAALALAAHMGCTAEVLAADADALAALRPRSGPPRRAPNLGRDGLIGNPHALTDAAKSASRLAFEARVCDVFDWRVGIAGTDYIDRGKVVVTANGAREFFGEMTPERRAEAGAVLLEHLALLFADHGHTEAALRQMLMVARGLEAAAVELAGAVADARAHGAA